MVRTWFSDSLGSQPIHKKLSIHIQGICLWDGWPYLINVICHATYKPCGKPDHWHVDIANRSNSLPPLRPFPFALRLWRWSDKNLTPRPIFIRRLPLGPRHCLRKCSFQKLVDPAAVLWGRWSKDKSQQMEVSSHIYTSIWRFYT